jgi:hypothetical protein
VFADKTSLPNLYYNQGRNSLWGQGSGRVYEVDNRNSQTIDARNNYWLNGATINGPVDTSDAVSEDFCSGWPKIVVESSPTLPKEFALNQNYPNPFNSSTVIEFSLPEASAVTIQVYNILGQKVRTLADNLYPPGVHLARWDGRNQAGMQVSSGLYFLLVQTDTHTACKKMTLLR